MIRLDEMEKAVRLMLGGDAWKVYLTKSVISDGVEIRITPRVTGQFHLAQVDLERYDKQAIAEWLYRELKATQAKLVDMLEKTLDRPKSKISGKCNFCGAPYNEKP